VNTMPAQELTTQAHRPAAAQVDLLQIDLARRLIAERYGFWVNDSWAGQLSRRLIHRAAATGRRGISDYLLGLHEVAGGEAELAELVEGLLNGETHFLRTAPHFAALLHTVIPDWRTSHRRGQRLRIASLGCSTGEEPYSIAMVLHEYLTTEELADVELSAVDVSTRALSAARIGAYEDFQLRELAPAQRSRWFTQENGRWQIHSSLRASVRFLHHNLMDPLPFAGLDVIFCRNVLIYFQRPVIAACLSEFHAALRPGGHLFLGHSESGFGFPEYFDPVQIPDGVIYRARPFNPFFS
jgi:chemotaxis methyl-accepting protein methylase